MIFELVLTLSLMYTHLFHKNAKHAMHRSSKKTFGSDLEHLPIFKALRGRSGSDCGDNPQVQSGTPPRC